jgi:hypothetical protein
MQIGTLWYHGRFVFQVVFVQIIEFLNKIFLENYTLTYFPPICTKMNQGFRCFMTEKHISEKERPFQNTFLSLMDGQIWSSKILHNF